MVDAQVFIGPAGTVAPALVAAPAVCATTGSRRIRPRPLVRRRAQRTGQPARAQLGGASPPPPPPPPPSDGEDALDVPPALDGRDWREFRALLFAGGERELASARKGANRPGFWGHPLALPERGAFLASHPALYRRNQPYLTQAVVLLTRHDHTGSSGLILNRPLARTVAELERGGMFGRSSRLADTPFADQPVYLGGPNSLGRDAPIAAIHGRCSDIPSDTEEPLSGVYTGSSLQALRLIESGRLRPEQVRLFYGCVKWEANALLDEVEGGEWYPASASAAFALEQCIGLPTPLWRELMECMGSVYGNIAKQVYDDADQPD